MASTLYKFAPTVAEIHLKTLQENVALLQQKAGGVPIMGVVKANGYGHGALEVALALLDVGVTHLAVATLPEGIELRKSGIEAPILVLGAPLPMYLEAYSLYGLDLNVSSLDILDVLQQNHAALPFRAHVKIDTGMGRLGMKPEYFAVAMQKMAHLPNVERIGIWSHFASSEEVQNPFNRQQLQVFNDIVRAFGSEFECVHIANSGALVNQFFAEFPKERQFARCGISMYGGMLASEMLPLKPVMRFSSKVVHLKMVQPQTTISYNQTWTASRKTQIATIAAGYADGVSRYLSNKGFVLIAGKRYPIVGRVCMDMCMVDVGEDSIRTGEEAVFWGDDNLGIDEVAKIAETISFTLLTGVGQRVPRIYCP